MLTEIVRLANKLASDVGASWLLLVDQHGTTIAEIGESFLTPEDRAKVNVTAIAQAGGVAPWFALIHPRLSQGHAVHAQMIANRLIAVIGCDDPNLMDVARYRTTRFVSDVQALFD